MKNFEVFLGRKTVWDDILQSFGETLKDDKFHRKTEKRCKGYSKTKMKYQLCENTFYVKWMLSHINKQHKTGKFLEKTVPEKNMIREH